LPSENGHNATLGVKGMGWRLGWKERQALYQKGFANWPGKKRWGKEDIAPAFAFHLVRGSDSFVITMTAKKSGIDLPFFTKFMSL